MIAIKTINNNINKRSLINNIITPLSSSLSSSVSSLTSCGTNNKILLNTKYIRRNLSTVSSQTIHITFVDLEGNRARVPALVGQTLLQVAQRHKVDLEGACDGGGSPIQVKRTENWTEPTFGEGPTCFYCHVQIPKTFHHLLPEQTIEETTGLKDVWEDEAGSTSRLACMITLDKKHDDMIVFIPDSPPVDVI
jgi:2Fe-2S ferredoxin